MLRRTPDAAHGRALYETCAACHGTHGEGVADGSVPAIGGQSYTVVARQIVEFRSGGRADPRMQHFSDSEHLAYSQEIADVAGYISQLPPRVAGGVSRDPQADRGSTLYLRSCERCHGATGEGKEAELAPRLAGQHAAYLRAQLTEAPAGPRPAMKIAHEAVLRSFSREDILAVTTYLSEVAAE